MDITELSRRISALRGRPVAVGAEVVGELLDDLAALAADDRITNDTATNLIARALRAIRPRAERPTDRDTALTQLRKALAEGPRQEGRQPAGTPRTVRAPDEVWALVDALSERNGATGSAATADLLAKAIEAVRRNTCAKRGCAEPATVRAGMFVYCRGDHVLPGERHLIQPLDAPIRVE